MEIFFAACYSTIIVVILLHSSISSFINCHLLFIIIIIIIIIYYYCSDPPPLISSYIIYFINKSANQWSIPSTKCDFQILYHFFCTVHLFLDPTHLSCIKQGRNTGSEPVVICLMSRLASLGLICTRHLLLSFTFTSGTGTFEQSLF